MIYLNSFNDEYSNIKKVNLDNLENYRLACLLNLCDYVNLSLCQGIVSVRWNVLNQCQAANILTNSNRSLL